MRSGAPAPERRRRVRSRQPPSRRSNAPSRPTVAARPETSGRTWCQTGHVHLRSIRLRGFKSFPDAVDVRLEPGVAVIIGPNGSGKSNVADAIVWAAGSLAPSALRAEKPEDVLFAGSTVRPGVDHCEVELLFDNADGSGPLPYSEIAIARRLHRGGEGQYLDQPGVGTSYGCARAPRRRRPRPRDARRHRAGSGRAGAVVEAGRAARPDRGGSRARELQAAAPSRRAEAGAGRDPGRQGALPRGGGAKAPTTARASGHGRPTGREARRRDRQDSGSPP